MKDLSRHALAIIEPVSPSPLSAVVLSLEAPEVEDRRHAAAALGRLSVAAAVPALIPALGDANVKVRGATAWTLGQIGPATPEVIPAQITRPGNADMRVRAAVTLALWRIGPAAVLTLTAALQDSIRCHRNGQDGA